MNITFHQVEPSSSLHRDWAASIIDTAGLKRRDRVQFHSQSVLSVHIFTDRSATTTSDLHRLRSPVRLSNPGIKSRSILGPATTRDGDFNDRQPQQDADFRTLGEPARDYRTGRAGSADNEIIVRLQRSREFLLIATYAFGKVAVSSMEFDFLINVLIKSSDFHTPRLRFVPGHLLLKRTCF